MRASRVIQAILSDQEVCENLACQQSLVDDPGHILSRDTSIPDPLGIDDDSRAMLALFKAAGMIGASQHPQSGSLELLAKRIAKALRTIRIARASPVPGFADISANKNVVSKRGHE